MTAIVRTFRAPDPRAALDAVRTALGEDAVIIDTRQVGGGLWSRPEIEITASTEPPSGLPGQPGDKVYAELTALRRLVEELRTRMPGDGGSAAFAPPPVDPEMSPLYRRLCERGVEPAVAERVVRQALQARGGRGDQYVRLKVVVPTQPTDREKQLYRELSDASHSNPRAGWEK